MIQVYTGDGKGKTTAALGLCFRASGHGLRSAIFFFMKGYIDYGELAASERTDGLITVEQCGRAEFVSKKNPEQIDIDMAQEGIVKARAAIESRNYDIIVLDEFNVALDFRLISLDQADELLRNVPSDLELVLTGRYCPEEVKIYADLITEMREIRHYYAKNVEARKGIEF
jgi:cob(I)alamin adenosyltransferase